MDFGLFLRGLAIGFSIAAYERSAEVNPFSSVFDDFWRKARAAGLSVETIRSVSIRKFENLGLSYVELNGLVLFNSKAKCSNCHLLTSTDGKPPVFTDFSYDNIGVPRNPRNPFFRLMLIPFRIRMDNGTCFTPVTS